MALTRVGRDVIRHLSYIHQPHASSRILFIVVIYQMKVLDPSLLLNCLLLLFDWPYVDKMAHFNIYLRIHKNMTNQTKLLCQLLIWHKCNRHRTLSLYLMVFCKSKPFLWYINYHIIIIQSWDIVGWMWMGCDIPIENIPHPWWQLRATYTTPAPPPPPTQLNHTNLFWSLEVSWKRFHLLIEKI